MAPHPTSIRIDTKLLAQSKKIAEELGTTLSNIVNMQLAQFVRTKRIHVDLVDENGLTFDQVKELVAIKKRLESGEDKAYGPFNGTKELFAHLDAVAEGKIQID